MDDVWLAGCARVDGAWEHTAPCQSAMVVRTTDGGESWQDFVFDASVPKLLAIEMVDELSGWAVGVGGSLVHTSNGGASWTTIDTGLDGILEGLDVYDENLAYAVGEENVILAYKPLSTQSLARCSNRHHHRWRTSAIGQHQRSPCLMPRLHTPWRAKSHPE